MSTRLAPALSLALVLCGLSPAVALAQAPLSAIDWLNRDDPAPVQWSVTPVTPQATEPPVAGDATVPAVQTVPLDQPSVAAVGLLAQSATGLPADLWQKSRAQDVIRLMGRADPGESPAMTALFATLLLAEATPPAGGATGVDLLGARVDALVRLGMVAPAEALLERAGAEDPALFKRQFDISLLTGTVAGACIEMRRKPHLMSDVSARVFCAARGQNWDLAANILQGAEALGDVDAARAELLWRFLDPELAESSPALSPPRDPDPLVFRLYEALGEPIPTAALPRAYAVTDLIGDAGWKAQLEAAERLARVGAIPENRLLGIYSERRRAASGGIWDRVEAVQRFDTALGVGDPTAVGSALERVWPHMQKAGLEAAFAGLYGARLLDLPLDSQAARLAAQVMLLSKDYELAAADLPADLPDRDVLVAVATGTAPTVRSGDDSLTAAVATAFGPDPAALVPDEFRRDLDDGKLGEVILRAIVLFDSGTDGNPADLEAALTTLRAVGLEDTARRAALHLLLTDHAGEVR